MIKSALNLKSLGNEKLNVGYYLLGVCEILSFARLDI